MANYFEDIINQPNSLKKAFDFYFSKDYMEKFEAISKLSFSNVLFTGMGSSNFASIGASIILNNAGISSEVTSTGQLVYYKKRVIKKDTLLVMVSQSGESGETVSLLKELNSSVKTVGITNNLESSLGKRADFVLPLNVEDEESVTTRTYIATLCINYILSNTIAGMDRELIKENLINAADNLEEFIGKYKDFSEKLYEFFKDINFIEAAGRGPSLSSAQASGLFLKEVSKFPSEGIDLAEFRHGPVEIADHNFGCIIFAPEGRTSDLGIKMAKEVSSHGGKVLLITNTEFNSDSENMMVMKYGKMDEMLTPVVDIVGAQLLCNILADKRGFVPGKFRWSSKITKEQ